MKQLHRPDLFNWSVFNEDRNIDFHGLCWVRPEGNVVIDPLPMSDHDRQHLQSLGSYRAPAMHLADVWAADQAQRVRNGSFATGDAAIPVRVSEPGAGIRDVGII